MAGVFTVLSLQRSRTSVNTCESSVLTRYSQLNFWLKFRKPLRSEELPCVVKGSRLTFFAHKGQQKAIKMNSHASIGGHPIHPMIIPFPIALWVFSLIADLIYLWGGNPLWRDYIAFYTLLGGIIGGAAAAVPGVIDWLSLKDREVVKIANWHARLNVIALLIFAASFYLRTTGGAGPVSGSYSIPVGLSVLGVILIAISGWLGGEMVFKHGVAVDQQSFSRR